ncbi:hypothetical protein PspLS_05126 [Pyricularia sp. CBS 133598]|nr:hypothetical protein PspLS_05126 [Pyricularia sp. CBS 133598]
MALPDGYTTIPRFLWSVYFLTSLLGKLYCMILYWEVMDSGDLGWTRVEDWKLWTIWCTYSRTVFTCTQCGEAWTYQTVMRVPCVRVLCGQVTDCGVQTIVSNRTVQRGRCSKH